MTSYTVTESRLIKAPAARVYSLLADYRNGHPRILPKKYFSAFEVEDGGFGAGTRIKFQMHSLGRTKTFRAAITELIPGRTLVETDLGSGFVTTFTVLPLDNGHGSHVTISSEVNGHDGVMGLVERSMTSMFLRRVFSQELKLLADFAEGRLGITQSESSIEADDLRVTE